MKYVSLALMYLLGIYFYTLFNFVDSGWNYLLVFLILILLVYFNNKNLWISYIFAAMCGLYQDSLSIYFGVYIFTYICIIFILSLLQNTILTQKNFLSVVALTAGAFVLYWLIIWVTNFISDRSVYTFAEQHWGSILKFGGISMFAILLLHLLYFNLWAKRNEKIQSF